MRDYWIDGEACNWTVMTNCFALIMRLSPLHAERVFFIYMRSLPAGQRAKVPAGECCPRCTGSCDTKVCPLGSSCKINEPTGEAFCAPSCSIDNGGCPRDQSCSLQVVSCIRAPCPPVVQCTDICALPVEPGPCRGSLPRFFHNSATGQCEAFTYGGCGGNSNNFMSLKECQENCQGM